MRESYSVRCAEPTLHPPFCKLAQKKPALRSALRGGCTERSECTAKGGKWFAKPSEHNTNSLVRVLRSRRQSGGCEAPPGSRSQEELTDGTDRCPIGKEFWRRTLQAASHIRESCRSFR